jgi:hypothetical protein
MLSFKSYLKLINEQQDDMSGWTTHTGTDGRTIKLPPGTRVMGGGKFSNSGVIQSFDQIHQAQNKQSSSTPSPQPTITRDNDEEPDLTTDADLSTVDTSDRDFETPAAEREKRKEQKLAALRAGSGERLVKKIPGAIGAARRAYYGGNNREAAIVPLVKGIQSIGRHSSNVTGGRTVADLTATGARSVGSMVNRLNPWSSRLQSGQPKVSKLTPRDLTVQNLLYPTDQSTVAASTQQQPPKQQVPPMTRSVALAGEPPAPLSPSTVARVRTAAREVGASQVTKWQ